MQRRQKTGRPPRPGPVRLVRAELSAEQADALRAYTQANDTTFVHLLQSYVEQLTGVPAWPNQQEQELDLSA